MASEFKTVSTLDPAIDHERMTRKAMAEYVKTRDMKHLMFRPGMEPTVYTLRQVPQDLWLWVESGDEDAAKFARAFRASLRTVTNMLNEDGTTMGKAPWAPAMDADGTLSNESMGRFDRFEINEIGGVAFVKSFFGKRTPPTYLLPPLLAGHLAGLAYLPADASPSLPAVNNSAASSPAEGATAPAQ
jgi:hypothetical protein